MELYFDKKGNIIRFGRPYINQEETNRIWAIYNPNEGPHYGLYDRDPELLSCNLKQYYWPKNTNRKPEFFLSNDPGPRYNFKKTYR